MKEMNRDLQGAYLVEQIRQTTTRGGQEGSNILREIEERGGWIFKGRGKNKKVYLKELTSELGFKGRASFTQTIIGFGGVEHPCEYLRC